ncbi:MAG: alpha/beta fold hydrolase [Candidatus Promineifilaceae bacterium]
MTNTSSGDSRSGYAPVNGLNMYYEVHGVGQPLLLLHGALSATETSFGRLLPGLAEGRQVISAEQQAHGRTADIDRPLSTEAMADDTAALLDHLDIEKADLFGYSLGSDVALRLAMGRPERVRKLVLASASYSLDGLHPGLIDGLQDLDPEAMVGTPFYEEYASIAPNPGDWAKLIAKNKQLQLSLTGWPAEKVAAIQAPTLLIIGDSDIIRPEHAVEMFRLLGGGVIGDLVGLPKSQLAIVPGATHITLVHQSDMLVPMITSFLDAPMPAAE